MTFRIHGAAQYRAWIERTLANARHLTESLRRAPEFELLHDPMLSTVCFRHVPPGVRDLDAHNLRIAREMQRDGHVFLAPASDLLARLLRELPDHVRGGRVRALGRPGARSSPGPGSTPGRG